MILKNMSVLEALAFADKSTIGATFYSGKHDAEAALAVLAGEVRKLREELEAIKSASTTS